MRSTHPWETDFYDPDLFEARAGEAPDVAALQWYLNTESPADTGDAVLDLGCGTGRLTKPLLERGYRVVAVDISERMLTTLRRKSSGWQPSQRDRLCTVLADARKLRLDETFGLAVAPDDFLTHFLSLDDLAIALRSIRLHLREGGIFRTDFRVRSSQELDVATGPGPYPVMCSGMVHGVAVEGRKRSVAAQYWKEFDSTRRILTTTMVFAVITPDGTVERTLYKTLRQRLHTAAELARTALAAGYGSHREERGVVVAYHELVAT